MYFSDSSTVKLLLQAFFFFSASFSRQSVCLYVIACYACTLELRRINIRNVLMSDESCQIKWGSVKQDNTVLPVAVCIL